MNTYNAKKIYFYVTVISVIPHIDPGLKPQNAVFPSIAARQIPHKPVFYLSWYSITADTNICFWSF
jgi:hypothetical protein